MSKVVVLYLAPKYWTCLFCFLLKSQTDPFDVIYLYNFIQLC